MAGFYEVWDDSTGNRLGEFETLADARAMLLSVLQESGPEAAKTLAVLRYTRQDAGDDDYQVVTVLEGTDVALQHTDWKARSAS